MQLPSIIISVIKDWVAPFDCIAPYQENPPDYVKGYMSLYPITSSPITTVGEKVTPTTLEFNQLMSWLYGFSFFKNMSYKENEVMPVDVATRVRHMLTSMDGIKAFNKHGLDMAPLWDDLIVDTFRDNDRNQFIQHAHFNVRFYKMDTTIIESETFERIEIKEVIDENDEQVGVSEIVIPSK